MIANKVYSAVQSYFANHDHKWLNKFIFHHGWESDFFCVSTSGYCIEVEVKVSKSDFIADFKKPKHELFKAITEGKKYCIKRGYEGATHEKQFDTEGKFLGYLRIPYCHIGFTELETANIPNKFWYAAPKGMIQNVPDYAGLIEVVENPNGEDWGPTFTITKKAPFIHKRKLDKHKLLFDKYFWDRISLMRENEELKRGLKKLTQLKEKAA